MRTAEAIASNDFIGIGGSEPVSKLIGKLHGAAHGASSNVCIMDEEEFVGLFSPRELIRSYVDVASMKVAKLAMPVPQLQPSDDLLAIASYMYDADVSMLPVVRNGKVSGVVHVLEVLKYLKELPELSGLKVRDVRHPAPVVVGEDEKIDTVLNILRDEHVDQVPVVDAAGRVTDIVTHSDILRNYYRHHIERDKGMQPKSRTRAFEGDRPDVPSLPVSNILERREIVTVSEDDLLRTAIDRMIARNTTCLLVLEDGRPAGIMTKKDVLEALIHSQVPQRDTVHYIGLEEVDIDSYEKLHVRRIVSRWAGKIEHFFHNQYELTVHVKEYERSGTRHKFSVNVRVTYPGATVPVTNAHAWDARTAVQEAFKRLESELARKYKTNKQVAAQRKTGRRMPLAGESPARHDV